MGKEDYLRTLQDPEAWFKQAFGQKMVADKLLHDVILKRDFLMKMKDNDDYSDYVHLWGNALLHYALGIENGLKGVIVKSKPELVHYKVTDEDVILIDIGGKASKKHDLYSLCNVAGLLDKNNDFQFGGFLFRNVMRSLTDSILWTARYPVPITNAKVFKIDEGVPSVVVYGFHILDVIEPVYMYFEKVWKEN